MLGGNVEIGIELKFDWQALKKVQDFQIMHLIGRWD